MKHTHLCLIAASLAAALLLTGCAGDTASQEEVSAAITEAAASATSVETSISLIMDARIGSAGSVDSHSASITSDITIRSNTDPYAYHAELFSRILVDGVTTRENVEYYVVPEDGDMVQYEYKESKRHRHQDQRQGSGGFFRNERLWPHDRHALSSGSQLSHLPV